MSYMFRVRSARALGPQALSRATSTCMPLVCRHHTPGPPASRLAPLPPRIACPLPSTRQYATAFNQPLSFDTSSVTDMREMFFVRSARALGHQALSRATSTCMPLVCHHHTPGRPASRLAPLPPRIACPLPSTRQGASAFNQPLSFDTFSVTTMYNMFGVRSARALAPSLELGPVHADAAAPYPLSRLPARTSPPIIYTPPFRLRQGAPNKLLLSAPNKLLIRCAWAGTAAFASAGYGSSWAPGTCA